MAKIAVITRYRRFLNTAKKIQNNYPSDEIKFYLAENDQAVHQAVYDAERSGCTAIVTGAFTCEMLKDYAALPIIDVEANIADIIAAWSKIKVKDLKPMRTAVFLLNSNPILNNNQLAKELSVIFETEVQLVVYNSKNEYERLIERLIGKVDVVIAGEHSIDVCERLGMPNEFLQIGINTMTMGVEEAIYISNIQRKDKIKRRRLINILDATQEGMIYINGEGIVEEFNEAAENILSVKNGIMRNISNIEIIFPEIHFQDVLASPEDVKEDILTLINGHKIVLSSKKLEIEGTIDGILLILRETEHIEEIEKKIRRDINRKGNIAKYRLQDIIGTSKAIENAKRLAKRFGMFDGNVLISGETGTGKELFAQAIHNESKRANEPFFAINCAALPISILESELFGYSEGAFTGARKSGKPGIFELAHGGTIYLDEVSEMDLSSQSKLLRVIQEKEVRRIGDEKIIPVDVRIIAASNRNMWKEVVDNRFREDLYYRINVMNISVAPLRERREDILFLIDYFSNEYSSKYSKDHNFSFTDSAKDYLQSYPWNGNVRELQNFVERLYVYGYDDQTIHESDLKLLIHDFKGEKHANLNIMAAPNSTDVGVPATMAEVELHTILCAIEKFGGNKTKAADYLGVSRTYLWRKINGKK